MSQQRPVDRGTAYRLVENSSDVEGQFAGNDGRIRLRRNVEG